MAPRPLFALTVLLALVASAQSQAVVTGTSSFDTGIQAAVETTVTFDTTGLLATAADRLWIKIVASTTTCAAADGSADALTGATCELSQTTSGVQTSGTCVLLLGHLVAGSTGAHVCYFAGADGADSGSTYAALTTTPATTATTTAPSTVTWGSAVRSDRVVSSTAGSITFVVTPSTALAQNQKLTFVASTSIYTAAVYVTCSASQGGTTKAVTSAQNTASSGSTYDTLVVVMGAALSSGSAVTIVCTGNLAGNPATGTAITFKASTDADVGIVSGQTGYTTGTAIAWTSGARSDLVEASTAGTLVFIITPSANGALVSTDTIVFKASSSIFTAAATATCVVKQAAPIATTSTDVTASAGTTYDTLTLIMAAGVSASTVTTVTCSANLAANAAGVVVTWDVSSTKDAVVLAAQTGYTVCSKVTWGSALPMPNAESSTTPTSIDFKFTPSLKGALTTGDTITLKPSSEITLASTPTATTCTAAQSTSFTATSSKDDTSLTGTTAYTATTLGFAVTTGSGGALVSGDTVTIVTSGALFNTAGSGTTCTALQPAAATATSNKDANGAAAVVVALTYTASGISFQLTPSPSLVSGDTITIVAGNTLFAAAGSGSTCTVDAAGSSVSVTSSTVSASSGANYDTLAVMVGTSISQSTLVTVTCTGNLASTHSTQGSSVAITSSTISASSDATYDTLTLAVGRSVLASTAISFVCSGNLAASHSAAGSSVSIASSAVAVISGDTNSNSNRAIIVTLQGSAVASKEISVSCSGNLAQNAASATAVTFEIYTNKDCTPAGTTLTGYTTGTSIGWTSATPDVVTIGSAGATTITFLVTPATAYSSANTITLTASAGVWAAASTSAVTCTASQSASLISSAVTSTVVSASASDTVYNKIVLTLGATIPKDLLTTIVCTGNLRTFVRYEAGTVVTWSGESTLDAVAITGKVGHTALADGTVTWGSATPDTLKAGATPASIALVVTPSETGALALNNVVTFRASETIFSAAANTACTAVQGVGTFTWKSTNSGNVDKEVVTNAVAAVYSATAHSISFTVSPTQALVSGDKLIFTSSKQVYATSSASTCSAMQSGSAITSGSGTVSASGSGSVYDTLALDLSSSATANVAIVVTCSSNLYTLVSGTASETAVTASSGSVFDILTVTIGKAVVGGEAVTFRCTSNLAPNPTGATAVKFSVWTTADYSYLVDQPGYTTMTTALTWGSAVRSATTTALSTGNVVFKFTPSATGSLISGKKITFISSVATWGAAGTDPTCSADQSGTKTITAAVSASNAGGAVDKLVVTAGATLAASAEITITCAANLAANGAAGTVVTYTAFTDSDGTASMGLTGYTVLKVATSVTWGSASVSTLKQASVPASLTLAITPHASGKLVSGDQVTFVSSATIFALGTGVACTAAQVATFSATTTKDTTPMAGVATYAGATIAFTMTTGGSGALVSGDVVTVVASNAVFAAASGTTCTGSSSIVVTSSATSASTGSAYDTIAITVGSSVGSSTSITFTCSGNLATTHSVTPPGTLVSLKGSAATAASGSDWDTLTITVAAPVAAAGALTFRCTGNLAPNPTAGAVTFSASTTQDVTVISSQTGYTTVSPTAPTATSLAVESTTINTAHTVVTVGAASVAEGTKPQSLKMVMATSATGALASGDTITLDASASILSGVGAMTCIINQVATFDWSSSGTYDATGSTQGAAVAYSANTYTFTATPDTAAALTSGDTVTITSSNALFAAAGSGTTCTATANSASVIVTSTVVSASSGSSYDTLTITMGGPIGAGDATAFACTGNIATSHDTSSTKIPVGWAAVTASTGTTYDRITITVGGSVAPALAFTTRCFGDVGVTFAPNAAANAVITFTVKTSEDTTTTTSQTGYTTGAATSAAFTSAVADVKTAGTVPNLITFIVVPTTALVVGDTITISANKALYSAAASLTCTATVSASAVAVTSAVATSTSALTVTMGGAVAASATTIVCKTNLAPNPAAGNVVFTISTNQDSTDVTGTETDYATAATSLAWTSATPDATKAGSRPNSIVFVIVSTSALRSAAGTSAVEVSDTVTFVSSLSLFSESTATTAACTASDGTSAVAITGTAVTLGTTVTITMGADVTAGDTLTFTCISSKFLPLPAAGTAVSFSASSNPDSTALTAQTGFTTAASTAIAVFSAAVSPLFAGATPATLTVTFTPTTALANGGTVTLVASKGIFAARGAMTCTAAQSGAKTVTSSVVSASANMVNTLILTVGEAIAAASAVVFTCTGNLASNAYVGAQISFTASTSRDTVALAPIAYTASTSKDGTLPGSVAWATLDPSLVFTVTPTTALVDADTVTFVTAKSMFTAAAATACVASQAALGQASTTKDSTAIPVSLSYTGTSSAGNVEFVMMPKVGLVSGDIVTIKATKSIFANAFASTSCSANQGGSVSVGTISVTASTGFMIDTVAIAMGATVAKDTSITFTCTSNLAATHTATGTEVVASAAATASAGTTFDTLTITVGASLRAGAAITFTCTDNLPLATHSSTGYETTLGTSWGWTSGIPDKVSLGEIPSTVTFIATPTTNHVSSDTVTITSSIPIWATHSAFTATTSKDATAIAGSTAVSASSGSTSSMLFSFTPKTALLANDVITIVAANSIFAAAASTTCTAAQASTFTWKSQTTSAAASIDPTAQISQTKYTATELIFAITPSASGALVATNELVLTASAGVFAAAGSGTTCTAKQDDGSAGGAAVTVTSSTASDSSSGSNYDRLTIVIGGAVTASKELTITCSGNLASSHGVSGNAVAITSPTSSSSTSNTHYDTLSVTLNGGAGTNAPLSITCTTNAAPICTSSGVTITSASTNNAKEIVITLGASISPGTSTTIVCKGDLAAHGMIYYGVKVTWSIFSNKDPVVIRSQSGYTLGSAAPTAGPTLAGFVSSAPTAAPIATAAPTASPTAPVLSSWAVNPSGSNTVTRRTYSDNACTTMTSGDSFKAGCNGIDTGGYPYSIYANYEIKQNITQVVVSTHYNSPCTSSTPWSKETYTLGVCALKRGSTTVWEKFTYFAATSNTVVAKVYSDNTCATETFTRPFHTEVSDASCDNKWTSGVSVSPYIHPSFKTSFAGRLATVAMYLDSAVDDASVAGSLVFSMTPAASGALVSTDAVVVKTSKKMFAATSGTTCTASQAASDVVVASSTASASAGGTDYDTLTITMTGAVAHSQMITFTCAGNLASSSISGSSVTFSASSSPSAKWATPLAGTTNFLPNTLKFVVTLGSNGALVSGNTVTIKSTSTLFAAVGTGTTCAATGASVSTSTVSASSGTMYDTIAIAVGATIPADTTLTFTCTGNLATNAETHTIAMFTASTTKESSAIVAQSCAGTPRNLYAVPGTCTKVADTSMVSALGCASTSTCYIAVFAMGKTTTTAPSEAPTAMPTAPTKAPTGFPTVSPTSPTSAPSAPTVAPSAAPVQSPTSPTVAPTLPTAAPTLLGETYAPTGGPTSIPTSAPTTTATSTPTSAPTSASDSPTSAPTVKPTWETLAPTAKPTTAAMLEPSSLNSVSRKTYSDSSCSTLIKQVSEKIGCHPLITNTFLKIDIGTTQGSIIYSDHPNADCTGTATDTNSSVLGACMAVPTSGGAAITEWEKFSLYETVHATSIVGKLYTDSACTTENPGQTLIHTEVSDGTCDSIYNSGIAHSSFKTTISSTLAAVQMSVYLGSRGTPDTACASASPKVITGGPGACSPITDYTLAATLGCASNTACFISFFPIGAATYVVEGHHVRGTVKIHTVDSVATFKSTIQNSFLYLIANRLAVTTREVMIVSVTYVTAAPTSAPTTSAPSAAPTTSRRRRLMSPASTIADRRQLLEAEQISVWIDFDVILASSAAAAKGATSLIAYINDATADGFALHLDLLTSGTMTVAMVTKPTTKVIVSTATLIERPVCGWVIKNGVKRTRCYKPLKSTYEASYLQQ